MSQHSIRSDDDPAGLETITAQRQTAPPQRWRWPVLQRWQRIAVAAVAAVLLFTIVYETLCWLAPTWIAAVLPETVSRPVHDLLHVFQAGAALVLLAGALSWLRHGGSAREQELQRASAIEGAIASMSAGVAVYDRNDRLVACNDAYRKLYPQVAQLLEPGTSHEAVLRAYYEHAEPGLTEGRSLHEFIGNRLRRREPDLPFTDRIRHFGGHWVMMSDCRTADGGLISLRRALTDDELQSIMPSRHRQAMEDLADLTHDGFWRTDAQGRLVELSPEATAMFGSKAADLLGRSVHELDGYWADDRPQREFDEHVARREPFPWFRFRVERADGKTTWLAACGKPVFGPDKCFAGYYGAVRDISEAETIIHALRRDEERFRALARLVTEWYWETDAQLRYTMVRGSSEMEPGLIENLIGRPFGRSAVGSIDEGDRGVALAAMAQRQPLQRLPFRVRYGDRPDRVFEISAEPMFRGEVFVGYRGLSLDVTERAALIDRLTASEARFRALTELSSDWYWETDSEYRFVRMERGALVNDHIAHLKPAEILGRTRWDLPGELIQPASWDEHRATLDARRPFRDLVVRRRGRDGSSRYIASSGDPMFDVQGRFLGYRGVGKDITDQVRLRENLERLATVDSLTGLANRHAFDASARVELGQAREFGRRCALLFIDLDNFRLLNNGYGHRAGDEVLRVVAERLQREVPQPRLLGRRGGDELVALLGDVASPQAVVELTRRLVGVISEPMHVVGLDLVVTPSIGISYFPHDGMNLEALVNAADAAMYEAKQNGRATYAMYTPSVARRVDLRLRLEQRLRKAIESRDFRLYFQPTVSLADGHVVGAEVLVRWIDAEVGEVSPAEFIPIAEESGLVIGLGDWVVGEACKACSGWRVMGLPTPPLAVNVAGVHLRQGNYVETLLGTLAEHGVPTGDLEIEVTETGLLDTSAAVRENLLRLRRAGIRLALDDFGVGFSSLVHLRDLPIHRLKIDRSFTVDCMRDARTLTIVKAVIEMARALGIKITAEGVETQAQQNWMQQLGCDSAQGYLFSRPLTADEFTGFLVEQRDSGRARSLMH